MSLFAESKNQLGQFSIGGIEYSISRPHRFGMVIHGPTLARNEDYLHEQLLAPKNRESFFTLIETEGLVVCKNVRSEAVSYRQVRGKSSGGKLSQAEYYHHDGCSGPTKPRLVEIRLPHQDFDRQVATAIAPFPDVIQAMMQALPARFKQDAEMIELHRALEQLSVDPDLGDKIQGRVTRMVRREMDAESCRAYFRDVDAAAGAYVLPWEMGESRLMLNSADDLLTTMQHRRAYQKPRKALEQNGSLVKRWTAEEL